MLKIHYRKNCLFCYSDQLILFFFVLLLSKYLNHLNSPHYKCSLIFKLFLENIFQHVLASRVAGRGCRAASIPTFQHPNHMICRITSKLQNQHPNSTLQHLNPAFFFLYCYHKKVVWNKGNTKPTDVSKSTEYRKKCIYK